MLARVARAPISASPLSGATTEPWVVTFVCRGRKRCQRSQQNIVGNVDDGGWLECFCEQIAPPTLHKSHQEYLQAVGFEGEGEGYQFLCQGVGSWRWSARLSSLASIVVGPANNFQVM